MKTNLLTVYVRSATGYGTRPIEERRLPPGWGSPLGYAARNFTLDLLGLDYSLPLSWEDIAAGAGKEYLITLTNGQSRTSLTMYRPPFTSTAYVIKIEEVQP